MAVVRYLEVGCWYKEGLECRDECIVSGEFFLDGLFVIVMVLDRVGYEDFSKLLR